MYDEKQDSGLTVPPTIPSDLGAIVHEKTIMQASESAPAPAWVEALRQEVNRTSQARAGRRLGISASTVCQVLSGSYKADTARIEALVRGELMHETVQCPVMGDVSKRRCVDTQALPFAATNPQRVALYRACRSGCPYSSLREEV